MCICMGNMMGCVLTWTCLDSISNLEGWHFMAPSCMCNCQYEPAWATGSMNGTSATEWPHLAPAARTPLPLEEWLASRRTSSRSSGCPCSHTMLHGGGNRGIGCRSVRVCLCNCVSGWPVHRQNCIILKVVGEWRCLC